MDKNLPVYVYDPTTADQASKVRGVGSYIQTLREVFAGEWNFVDDKRNVPKNSIFINPFFDTLKPPMNIFFKISRRQIAVIHDVIPLKYPKYFPTGFIARINKFLNRWSIKTYDIIITDSEHSKKDIVKKLGINKKKIVVVYPTVKEIFRRPIALSDSYEHSLVDADKKDFKFSLQEHATHLEMMEDESHILQSIPFPDFCIYVGDGTWNKNLLNLAEAIKIAQTPCVIVGKAFIDMQEKIIKSGDKKPNIDPWQESLYKFCQRTINNPLFHFAGYLEDHDLILLYRKAKVNILLSYDEGFGLSYVEASYIGTPSVLGNTPLFHETAKEAAIFADLLNPTDIADKIRKTFFQEELRRHLRVNAFERAYDFSPEKFKDEMNKIIDSLSKNI